MQELLKKAKQGDKSSMEALINKFEPLIKKSSKKYYINGYEQKDVKQLAYMATLKAIKRFDTERSNYFPLYVKRTIQNSIYKELQKSKEKVIYNKSNKELREITEIKEISEIKNIEDEGADPEEEIIKKERREELSIIISKLNPEERNFIKKLFIEKITLKEYAEERNIEYHKAVYQKKKVLQKVSTLLKSY